MLRADLQGLITAFLHLLVVIYPNICVFALYCFVPTCRITVSISADLPVHFQSLFEQLGFLLHIVAPTRLFYFILLRGSSNETRGRVRTSVDEIVGLEAIFQRLLQSSTEDWHCIGVYLDLQDVLTEQTIYHFLKLSALCSSTCQYDSYIVAKICGIINHSKLCQALLNAESEAPLVIVLADHLTFLEARFKVKIFPNFLI